jgi:anti-sigma B factor antagonist
MLCEAGEDPGRLPVPVAKRLGVCPAKGWHRVFREKDLDGRTKLLTLETTRLDAATANALKDRVLPLAESGQDGLVIDLKPVEFIDSSGLGVLVGMLKKLGTRGRIVICNLQPNVANTFKLSRMDRVFTIRPSVDDAFASLER